MNPETWARECQLRSDLLRSKDVSPKDFKQNYIITFLLEQTSFDNNLRKKKNRYVMRSRRCVMLRGIHFRGS